jgi:hypothetical protein
MMVRRTKPHMPGHLVFTSARLVSFVKNASHRRSDSSLILRIACVKSYGLAEGSFLAAISCSKAATCPFHLEN